MQKNNADAVYVTMFPAVGKCQRENVNSILFGALIFYKHTTTVDCMFKYYIYRYMFLLIYN